MLPSSRALLSASTIAIMGFSALRVSACEPIDFFTVAVPLDTPAPAIDALRLAYDDISLSPDGRALTLNGDNWLEIGTIRDIQPEEMLRDPTILEQFKYRYPLEFDLTQRVFPFVDPGRSRNEEFFEGLYFDTELAARKSIVSITEPELTKASFQVTRKRNVGCQLGAALAALAVSGEDYSAVFKGAGGGFNWRVIAGTTRLSTHSFGIAFDLNPELGKYWLWTGAREGAVGHYENAIPESLVTTMERFGFIWGGKWHHFDGMHFEFRPELILYSRMVPD